MKCPPCGACRLRREEAIRAPRQSSFLISTSEEAESLPFNQIEHL
jgi:hypothetical protein